jgi:hypothetical protein
MSINYGDEFDKMLKRAVRKSNLPLFRLAKQAGVQQPSLWRWLENRQGLSLETQSKLCEYLEKQRGLHGSVVLMKLIGHWQAALTWLDEQLAKLSTGDDEDDDAKTERIVAMGKRDIEKRLADCKAMLQKIRPDFLHD